MPTEVIARVLGGKAEEKLLTLFFVLYKTARIIDESNAMFKNQSASFYEHLQSFCNEVGDVTIKAIGGHFFVNERMSRFDEGGQVGATAIIQEWRTLGLGGVTFDSTITLEELRTFIAYIAAVKPKSANVEELAAQLKVHGHSKVRLLSLKREGLGSGEGTGVSVEDRKQFRAIARSSFFQAMTVVEELVVNTMHDREVNIAKTKRIVHTLIDHIIRDEYSLLELAAIKHYDDYTYAHSTNVCVYALTLGVRLGLDRVRLSELGFTALFHDIGKVKLPTDLIRKPDAFDEDDWVQMQRHPMLGAKTILYNQKFDQHTARAARGAFEHHINSDFTGYPMLRQGNRTTNLFSRIISVVDTFDALASGRVYLRKSIPPDEVIRKMRHQMAVKFDPFLLKIFNDVIGIYPAGSLVLLTTEEIALVLTNNESDMARPYIKIVGNRHGLLEEPIWVDLAQPEEAERKIVRCIDPARYGLDLKDFVLKD